MCVRGKQSNLERRARDFTLQKIQLEIERVKRSGQQQTKSIEE